MDLLLRHSGHPGSLGQGQNLNPDTLLEQDRFPWPKDGEAARSITADQLRMLLDGIDFWRAHQSRSYAGIG